MPKATSSTMDFSTTIVDMMEHLEWSYGVNRGYAVLGAFNRETDKITQYSFQWPQAKEEIAVLLSHQARQPWVEVFYCPLLRQTTKRSLGNASHRDLLWADIDKGMSEETRRVIQQWGARIVHTGSVGSYHVYLKLDIQLNEDQHRNCEEALRAYLGADNKIADNDFLKLPGSWNYKNHPSVHKDRRLSEPTLSRVQTDGTIVRDVFQKLSVGRARISRPVSKNGIGWDGQVKTFSRLPDAIRQLQAERSEGDGSGRFRRAYNAVRTVAECKTKEGKQRFTLEDAHSILHEYGPGVDKFESRVGGWHGQIAKLWQDWEDEHRIITMEEAIDDLLWTKRESLEHIHTCSVLSRVLPWTVFGAELARVVTRIPYNVELPGVKTKSLNLFVGLIGKSGSGKGAGTSVAEKCVDLGFVPTVELGTGPGLVAAYKRKATVQERKEGKPEEIWKTRSMLFMAPEIGLWEGRIAKPEDPLKYWLCQAWSGESVGGQLKTTDLDIRLEPNTYRMCMVMGIQPAMAGPLIKNVANGTPQRWLWLPAGRLSDKVKAQDLPPPLIWPEPDWPFSEKKWGRRTYENYEIPFPGSVQEEIEAWEDERTERENMGLVVDEYAAHEMLLRSKVCVGLMALDGRVEVNEEDWELAGYVMAKSNAQRKAVIQELQRIEDQKEDYVSKKKGRGASLAKRAEKDTDEKLERQDRKNRRQAMARKLVALIKQSPGITKRGLLAKVNDAQLMNSVLKELVERGKVKQRDDPYKGRSRFRYFYV